MVNSGKISRIIDFSFVDGPGNRMVIFLQGCNFSCGYCHNPETINICRNCGECVSVCPNSALAICHGKIIYTQENCSNCDLCLSTCKYSSSPKTSEYTVEAILKRVDKVKSFIQGITMSGGECTLQWQFIKDFFERLNLESKLTRFIDTNGDLGVEALENLLPLTDGFMLDIKAVDEDAHMYITGKGNSQVIRNIRTIYREEKLYELRYVIVPKVNDKYEDILKLGDFVNTLNANQRLVLIPFRNFGVKGRFKEFEQPSEMKVAEFKETLLRMGLKNLIVKD